MRIYCDGVFDLLHSGHIKHFDTILELNPNCKLIVGVVTDEDAESYKRKPIMTFDSRIHIISKINGIETCIKAPLLVTNDFINEHHIDLIYHAFSNENDIDVQKEFFKVPLELGIMRTVPYNHGISTSQTISEWNKIWDKKSQIQKDPRVLAGWEETDYCPKKLVSLFREQTCASVGDTILDIGIGSGYTASFMHGFNIIGMEQSPGLQSYCTMNTNIFCIQSAYPIVPFKNESFDWVFTNSVLQYLDTIEQVLEAMNESIRVSVKGVFVSNIRHSPSPQRNKHVIKEGTVKHLIIDPKILETIGFKILPSSYDPEHYFSAVYLK
jgi:cytidyltransferase-like protein